MGSRPLVTITIAFAGGILLAAQIEPGMRLDLACLFFLLIVVAGYFANKRTFWFRTALLVSLFLAGSLRYQIAQRVAADDIAHFDSQEVTAIGTVASDVQEDFPDYSRTTPAGPRRFTLAVQRLVLPESATSREQNFIPASGLLAVHFTKYAQEQNTNVTSIHPQKADLGYGETVLVRGRVERPSGPRNPGDFDARTYLAHHGIYATLTVMRDLDWHPLPTPSPSFPGWLRWAYVLRQRTIRAIRGVFSREQAGVLSGVLLGDHADLPPDLQADFQYTGTGHILATAGLHVGVLTALLLGIFRLCRLPRRAGSLLTLLGLAFFVAMSGGRPAVVRAALIAGYYLVGLLLEREADWQNAIAFAALVLLAWNPANLLESGFQYSFATVVTIVLLMPFVTPVLRRLRKRLSSTGPFRFVAELYAASFFLAACAQTGVLPLVARNEHLFSPIAVLTNLLVVPWIALVFTLGYAFVLLSTLFPTLALPPALLLKPLLACIIAIIRGSASLPGAFVGVPSPPLPLVVGYYGLIWYAAWRWRPCSEFENSPPLPEGCLEA